MLQAISVENLKLLTFCGQTRQANVVVYLLVVLDVHSNRRHQIDLVLDLRHLHLTFRFLCVVKEILGEHIPVAVSQVEEGAMESSDGFLAIR